MKKLLITNQLIRCWGYNYNGYIGVESATSYAIDPSTSPKINIGVAFTPIGIFAQSNGMLMCAVLQTGRIR